MKKFTNLGLLAAYNIFYSKYASKSLDPTRSTLLEYGGGPAVAFLVSASPYVKKIVFSDYVDSNLKAVAKWRDREDGRKLDWER